MFTFSSQTNRVFETKPTKVIVVSDSFAGQRLIGRHRQAHQILADELDNQIHALAIHTYTDEEWKREQDGAPDSPMCMGGGH